MGREGKVVFSRTAVRKKSYVNDEEDDEEYVAEEDSSYGSGSSNEESLYASDASNSTSSSKGKEEKRYDKVKSRRGYTSGCRRSRISNCDQWEDDEYEDDEDFMPDAIEEEDWEEESLVLGDIGASAMRGATKRARMKLKSKVSRKKVKKVSRKVAATPRKRKRRRMASSSNDEDNYIVNARSATKIHRRKDSKKLSKRTGKSVSSKKNKSQINAYFDSDYLTSDDDPSLRVQVATSRSRTKKKGGNYRRNKKLQKKDSETSDSDFVVSDEEILDNDCIGLARLRNSSTRERKNARISRKPLLLESKCSNFDVEIPEGKVNNLEIESGLNLRKHEGISEAKKGKEKEADDLGKQFCGICLSEEHEGTIQGSLNCCSHYFCFACILEWSKVESRCPLCKRRFVTIAKSSRSDPMLQLRRHVIRVQMRDQVYQPSEEELRVLLDPYEDVVCMECHQGGDDSLMLLCDICDSSAHTYCVGLGKEVPEGNWYCDCCKLAGDGSSHSQVLDTSGASNSLMLQCSVEENGCNPQSSSLFERSVLLQGQSSSPRSDFNLHPPRNYMEGGAVSTSQAPGAWASTLSGRRAARQHVRIYFSNSRSRQLHTVPNRTGNAVHTEAVHHSVLVQNEEQFCPSERPNSLYRSREQRPENRRDFPHLDSNLAQQMSNNGRTFRRVNGAKKQVHSMVKHYLKKLPMAIPLERSAFKKTVRKATNTILASCGIHHSRSAVPFFHEPPKGCSHDLDGGPVCFVTGCCSSCFGGYVEHVVDVLVGTL